MDGPTKYTSNSIGLSLFTSHKLIGALSVVTDFYSVLLPAALVLQIQISRKQKIGLFFIFGLGML